MPSLSALIHVQNDGSGLARTLETLRPTDDVVVVDHGSHDAMERVVRDYGARMVKAVPGVDKGAYAVNCKHDWVLCLLPNESLSEALEASLFEWKQAETDPATSFTISIREQNGADWQALEAETRLVNKTTVNWQGATPPAMSNVVPLAGDLLRFKDTD
jgi:hypothetical protein